MVDLQPQIDQLVAVLALKDDQEFAEQAGELIKEYGKEYAVIKGEWESWRTKSSSAFKTELARKRKSHKVVAANARSRLALLQLDLMERLHPLAQPANQSSEWLSMVR
jgi:hypothetical protein